MQPVLLHTVLFCHTAQGPSEGVSSNLLLGGHRAPWSTLRERSDHKVQTAWPRASGPVLGTESTRCARCQRSLTSRTHSPGKGTGNGSLHPAGKQENCPEREMLRGKHVGPKLMPKKGSGGLPAQSQSQFLGDTAVRKYSLKSKGGGKSVCKERGVAAATQRAVSPSIPALSIPALTCFQTSPAHPYVQMTELTVRVQLHPLMAQGWAGTVKPCPGGDEALQTRRPAEAAAVGCLVPGWGSPPGAGPSHKSGSGLALPSTCVRENQSWIGGKGVKIDFFLELWQ